MTTTIPSFFRVLNNGNPNFGLAADTSGQNAKVLIQITGNLSIDTLDIVTDDTELMIIEINSVGRILKTTPVLTFGSVQTMPSPAAIKVFQGFYYVLMTFIGSVTLNNGDVFTSPLQNPSDPTPQNCHKNGGIMLSTPTPLSSSLLIKLNSDGQIQWTTEITGIMGNRVRLSVATDQNIYLALSYMLTTEVVSASGKISTIESTTGRAAALLLKFDSEGELCWSLAGTSGISFANDLSLISSQLIAVIGTFSGTLNLDDEMVSETQAASGVFVAIVTSEGRLAVVTGENNVDRPQLYAITGLVSGTNFRLTGMGISASSSSLVLTGEISGSFFFAPFSITARTRQNTYIAKWNLTNQIFDWVRVFNLDEIPDQMSFPTITMDSRGVIYGSVFSRQNVTVFDQEGNIIIIITGQSEPILVVYSINSNGNFRSGSFFEPAVLTENEPLAVNSLVYTTGSLQTAGTTEAFIAGLNL